MTQQATAMQAAFFDLEERNALLVMALYRIRDATGVTDDGASIHDMVIAIEEMRQTIKRLRNERADFRNRCAALALRNADLNRENEILQALPSI